jgi:thiosulfate dehydrogenase [quinone] large subunit
MFTETGLKRTLIVLFRISLGWVFLFAAIRQIPNPEFSAAGFMEGATTFAWFFAIFAEPPFLTIINVVIPWLHLLLGLALILGIGVRAAGVVGATLMVLYYLPRLDFPMVGPNNFIVEYHLVYAGVLVYLAAVRAGQIFGVEGWLQKQPAVHQYLEQHPVLKSAIA